jgi:hypothetical protein
MGSSRLSDVSDPYSAAGSSRSVENPAEIIWPEEAPPAPHATTRAVVACRAHRPANNTINTDFFALIFQNAHGSRASGTARPQGPCSGHQGPKPSMCRSSLRRRATAVPRVPRLRGRCPLTAPSCRDRCQRFSRLLRDFGRRLRRRRQVGHVGFVDRVRNLDASVAEPAQDVHVQFSPHCQAL